MADKVLNWMKAAITKHFGLNETTRASGDAEDDLQRYHLHQLLTTFVGRKEELKLLEKFADSPRNCDGVNYLEMEEKVQKQAKDEELEESNSNAIFFLVGDRGVGKTALLAAFARTLRKNRKDLRVFYHFPSASLAAISVPVLLRRLAQFAGAKRDEADSYNLEKKSKECWQKLGSSGKKTVVIFDGLDKVRTI